MIKKYFEAHDIVQSLTDWVKDLDEETKYKASLCIISLDLVMQKVLITIAARRPPAVPTLCLPRRGASVCFCLCDKRSQDLIVRDDTTYSGAR